MFIHVIMEAYDKFYESMKNEQALLGELVPREWVNHRLCLLIGEGDLSIVKQ